MILTLHLILFLPLVAAVGFAVCAIFAGAKMDGGNEDG